MKKLFTGAILTLLLVSGCADKKMSDDEDLLDGMRADGSIEPGTQADLHYNVGDTILFDFDSSSVNSDSRSLLERQAEWIGHHDRAVIIEGHCDERGTREYNLALGERRAVAVKNYLQSLGVDPHRIDTVSYGKERPTVAGTGEEVWAQNRRAVTIVLK